MTEGVDDLASLHAQIRACRLCGLHATRTQAVPGSGPAPPCDVMIVGEAPGFNEDQQGEPFVGPAGRLLDTLLGQIGLSRKQVFITNVLKCRPPQNRDPMPTEAEACLPYLRRQFTLLQPKAVLVLGSHALERTLPGVGPISRVHGQIFERMGVAFMPAYHPAAALRNTGLLDDLQKDFDRVRAHLDSLREGEATPEPAPDPAAGVPPEPPAPSEPPTEQLRLI